MAHSIIRKSTVRFWKQIERIISKGPDGFLKYPKEG